MPIKTKLFILLHLPVAMALVVACRIQPGQAAQNSPQLETHIEESLPEELSDEDEHDHDEALELSAIDLTEDEKLKVVATTNIVGDLVDNVGGDMIELTNMLPTGVDPHTFTPTPQNATALADAHVIVINGLHLEAFLSDLIENAGSEAPLVVLSANVETRQFGAMERHLEDEYDEDEHAHSGVDPHIWMTPANAIIMVHNIEHALTKLDPANAEAYQANTKTYVAQLEELDTWVKRQIQTIPAENRQLVTDHDALGYYADRYGLKVVGTIVPVNTTDAEPSARELAALQNTIEELDTKAIFVGTTVNPVLAERMAEDMGIKLVSLYTGSLGEPDSGVETYIDFIRYNTTAIVNAVK